MHAGCMSNLHRQGNFRNSCLLLQMEGISLSVGHFAHRVKSLVEGENESDESSQLASFRPRIRRRAKLDADFFLIHHLSLLPLMHQATRQN